MKFKLKINKNKAGTKIAGDYSNDNGDAANHYDKRYKQVGDHSYFIPIFLFTHTPSLSLRDSLIHSLTFAHFFFGKFGLRFFFFGFLLISYFSTMPYSSKFRQYVCVISNFPTPVVVWAIRGKKAYPHHIWIFLCIAYSTLILRARFRSSIWFR